MPLPGIDSSIKVCTLKGSYINKLTVYREFSNVYKRRESFLKSQDTTGLNLETPDTNTSLQDFY